MNMEQQTVDLATDRPEMASSLSLSISDQAVPCGVGHGSAPAHHGELFQGVLEGADGRLRRGLVTFPCNLFRSQATFRPEHTGTIKIEPAWKVKTHKAVKLTLERSNLRHLEGRLTIESNIPTGWGLGSSTSDVIAAIRAIADSFNQCVDPNTIAALAVEAETASDSTMYDEGVVLFAQREGVIIEHHKHPFPFMEVLGFNTDPTGKGVDTLGFTPAPYTCWEIEAFRPIVGLLRRALFEGDARMIGHVATASAVINQRYLPKPRFDALQRLVEEVGAMGLQVAHTGTVVGLLFDAFDSEKEARLREAQKKVEELGFHQNWRFQTGENCPSRDHQ